MLQALADGLAWVPDFTLATLTVALRAICTGPAGEKLAFSDLLSPAHVGSPAALVSHAWPATDTPGSPLALTLTLVLEHFCAQQMKPSQLAKKHVWLDAFAVSPHPERSGKPFDIVGLERVVREAGKHHGTLLVLDPHARALNRLWCLLELWRTVDLVGGHKLCVLADGLEGPRLGRAWDALAIDTAAAAVAEDRIRILEWLHHRWTNASRLVNRALKKAVMSSVVAEAERALTDGGGIKGCDTPDLSEAWGICAAFLQYCTPNDRREAERLFTKALQACQVQLGPFKPLTLATAGHLGTLLQLRGDASGAESLYRQVLEGQRAKRGPEHPATVKAAQQLAALIGSDDPPSTRLIEGSSASAGPSGVQASVKAAPAAPQRDPPASSPQQGSVKQDTQSGSADSGHAAAASAGSLTVAVAGVPQEDKGPIQNASSAAPPALAEVEPSSDDTATETEAQTRGSLHAPVVESKKEKPDQAPLPPKAAKATAPDDAGAKDASPGESATPLPPSVPAVPTEQPAADADADADAPQGAEGELGDIEPVMPPEGSPHPDPDTATTAGQAADPEAHAEAAHTGPPPPSEPSSSDTVAQPAQDEPSLPLSPRSDGAPKHAVAEGHHSDLQSGGVNPTPGESCPEGQVNSSAVNSETAPETPAPSATPDDQAPSAGMEKCQQSEPSSPAPTRSDAAPAQPSSPEARSPEPSSEPTNSPVRGEEAVAESCPSPPRTSSDAAPEPGPTAVASEGSGDPSPSDLSPAPAHDDGDSPAQPGTDLAQQPAATAALSTASDHAPLSEPTVSTSTPDVPPDDCASSSATAEPASVAVTAPGTTEEQEASESMRLEAQDCSLQSAATPKQDSAPALPTGGDTEPCPADAATPPKSEPPPVQEAGAPVKEVTTEKPAGATETSVDKPQEPPHTPGAAQMPDDEAPPTSCPAAVPESSPNAEAAVTPTPSIDAEPLPPAPCPAKEEATSEPTADTTQKTEPSESVDGSCEPPAVQAVGPSHNDSAGLESATPASPAAPAGATPEPQKASGEVSEALQSPPAEGSPKTDCPSPADALPGSPVQPADGSRSAGEALPSQQSSPARDGSHPASTSPHSPPGSPATEQVPSTQAAVAAEPSEAKPAADDADATPVPVPSSVAPAPVASAQTPPDEDVSQGDPADQQPTAAPEEVTPEAHADSQEQPSLPTPAVDRPADDTAGSPGAPQPAAVDPSCNDTRAPPEPIPGTADPPTPSSPTTDTKAEPSSSAAQEDTASPLPHGDSKGEENFPSAVAHGDAGPSTTPTPGEGKPIVEHSDETSQEAQESSLVETGEARALEGGEPSEASSPKASVLPTEDNQSIPKTPGSPAAPEAQAGPAEATEGKPSQALPAAALEASPGAEPVSPPSCGPALAEAAPVAPPDHEEPPSEGLETDPITPTPPSDSGRSERPAASQTRKEEPAEVKPPTTAATPTRTSKDSTTTSPAAKPPGSGTPPSPWAMEESDVKALLAEITGQADLSKAPAEAAPSSGATEEDNAPGSFVSANDSSRAMSSLLASGSDVSLHTAAGFVTDAEPSERSFASASEGGRLLGQRSDSMYSIAASETEASGAVSPGKKPLRLAKASSAVLPDLAEDKLPDAGSDGSPVKAAAAVSCPPGEAHSEEQDPTTTAAAPDDEHRSGTASPEPASVAAEAAQPAPAPHVVSSEPSIEDAQLGSKESQPQVTEETCDAGDFQSATSRSERGEESGDEANGAAGTAPGGSAELDSPSAAPVAPADTAGCEPEAQVQSQSGQASTAGIPASADADTAATGTNVDEEEEPASVPSTSAVADASRQETVAAASTASMVATPPAPRPAAGDGTVTPPPPASSETVRPVTPIRDVVRALNQEIMDRQRGNVAPSPRPSSVTPDLPPLTPIRDIVAAFNRELAARQGASIASTGARLHPPINPRQTAAAAAAARRSNVIPGRPVRFPWLSPRPGPNAEPPINRKRPSIDEDKKPSASYATAGGVGESPGLRSKKRPVSELVKLFSSASHAQETPRSAAESTGRYSWNKSGGSSGSWVRAAQAQLTAAGGGDRDMRPGGRASAPSADRTSGPGSRPAVAGGETAAEASCRTDLDAVFKAAGAAQGGDKVPSPQRARKGSPPPTPPPLPNTIGSPVGGALRPKAESKAGTPSPSPPASPSATDGMPGPSQSPAQAAAAPATEELPPAKGSSPPEAESQLRESQTSPASEIPPPAEASCVTPKAEAEPEGSPTPVAERGTVEDLPEPSAGSSPEEVKEDIRVKRVMRLQGLLRKSRTNVPTGSSSQTEADSHGVGSEAQAITEELDDDPPEVFHSMEDPEDVAADAVPVAEDSSKAADTSGDCATSMPAPSGCEDLAEPAMASSPPEEDLKAKRLLRLRSLMRKSRAEFQDDACEDPDQPSSPQDAAVPADDGAHRTASGISAAASDAVVKSDTELISPAQEPVAAKEDQPAGAHEPGPKGDPASEEDHPEVTVDEKKAAPVPKAEDVPPQADGAETTPASAPLGAAREGADAVPAERESETMVQATDTAAASQETTAEDSAVSFADQDPVTSAAEDITQESLKAEAPAETAPVEPSLPTPQEDIGHGHEQEAPLESPNKAVALGGAATEASEDLECSSKDSHASAPPLVSDEPLVSPSPVQEAKGHSQTEGCESGPHSGPTQQHEATESADKPETDLPAAPKTESTGSAPTPGTATEEKGGEAESAQLPSKADVGPEGEATPTKTAAPLREESAAAASPSCEPDRAEGEPCEGAPHIEPEAPAASHEQAKGDGETEEDGKSVEAATVPSEATASESATAPEADGTVSPPIAADKDRDSVGDAKAEAGPSPAAPESGSTRAAPTEGKATEVDSEGGEAESAKPSSQAEARNDPEDAAQSSHTDGSAHDAERGEGQTQPSEDLRASTPATPIKGSSAHEAAGGHGSGPQAAKPEGAAGAEGTVAEVEEEKMEAEQRSTESPSHSEILSQQVETTAAEEGVSAASQDGEAAASADAGQELTSAEKKAEPADGEHPAGGHPPEAGASLASHGDSAAQTPHSDAVTPRASAGEDEASPGTGDEASAPEAGNCQSQPEAPCATPGNAEGDDKAEEAAQSPQDNAAPPEATAGADVTPAGGDNKASTPEESSHDLGTSMEQAEGSHPPGPKPTVAAAPQATATDDGKQAAAKTPSEPQADATAAADTTAPAEDCRNAAVQEPTPSGTGGAADSEPETLCAAQCKAEGDDKAEETTQSPRDSAVHLEAPADADVMPSDGADEASAPAVGSEDVGSCMEQAEGSHPPASLDPEPEAKAAAVPEGATDEVGEAAAKTRSEPGADAKVAADTPALAEDCQEDSVQEPTPSGPGGAADSEPEAPCAAPGKSEGDDKAKETTQSSQDTAVSADAPASAEVMPAGGADEASAPAMGSEDVGSCMEQAEGSHPPASLDPEPEAKAAAVPEGATDEVGEAAAAKTRSEPGADAKVAADTPALAEDCQEDSVQEPTPSGPGGAADSEPEAPCAAPGKSEGDDKAKETTQSSQDTAVSADAPASAEVTPAGGAYEGSTPEAGSEDVGSCVEQAEGSHPPAAPEPEPEAKVAVVQEGTTDEVGEAAAKTSSEPEADDTVAADTAAPAEECQNAAAQEPTPAGPAEPTESSHSGGSPESKPEAPSATSGTAEGEDKAIKAAQPHQDNSVPPDASIAADLTPPGPDDEASAPEVGNKDDGASPSKEAGDCPESPEPECEDAEVAETKAGEGGSLKTGETTASPFESEAIPDEIDTAAAAEAAPASPEEGAAALAINETPATSSPSEDSATVHANETVSASEEAAAATDDNADCLSPGKADETASLSPPREPTAAMSQPASSTATDAEKVATAAAMSGDLAAAAGSLTPAHSGDLLEGDRASHSA